MHPKNIESGQGFSRGIYAWHCLEFLCKDLVEDFGDLLIFVSFHALSHTKAHLTCRFQSLRHGFWKLMFDDCTRDNCDTDSNVAPLVLRARWLVLALSG